MTTLSAQQMKAGDRFTLVDRKEFGVWTATDVVVSDRDSDFATTEVYATRESSGREHLLTFVAPLDLVDVIGKAEVVR